MEQNMLIKAGMKQHKGSLIGIFLLIFMVSLMLATVLAMGTNASSYIKTEMDRAGFGEVTAWVSDVPDMEALQGTINTLHDVGAVESQSLIYTEYEVKGQESDQEGQLIAYQAKEERYRFFTENLTGYREAPTEIRLGEVYVSSSMLSMMNVHMGDEIIFPIARNGVNRNLIVAGYYEDPFMGSSMIGMKGFLIAEEEQATIQGIIRETGMDALAREGAMLHIFTKEGSKITTAQLNQRLNENTELPMYTEFIYSKNAILGFMLILQNAFGGLFLAFALVLLCIAMVVIGHSIQAVMEQESVNLGILKTIGMTTGKLARIQLLQYMVGMILGMLLGMLLSIPLGGLVSRGTVTTTGMLFPNCLPIFLCILCFTGMAVLLTGFVLLKLKKIGNVTPMKVIWGETNHWSVNPEKMVEIGGNWLEVSLAIRQLVSGKRRYVGVGLVAILLVFFASLVGRMDSWLGPDGKGMMDAFNPADHDIAVQTVGQLTAEEAENTILSYTDITDSYLLAMPDVSVNGVNYTANVITEPERFHIIRGHTITSADEIVLTESAALDLGVSIGDAVSIGGDKGVDDYTLSGIYQCANDMGNNIGMSKEGYASIGQDNANLWCYHYFLADTSMKQVITKDLEKAYGGDVHIHENSWPGLFGIISAMQVLLLFLYGIVVFFVLIVTVMTGSKMLAAEQKDMGIYKSLGFSSVQLRITFALRFGMAAFLGAAIGTVLAALLTDPLVSSVMKLVSISNFASAPSFGMILLPGAVVTILFTLFAYAAAGKIKKVDMAVLAAK